MKPLGQCSLTNMCCMNKLGSKIGTLQMINTLNQTVYYSGFVYLRNSMIEAADGSPNYWLWLDMDHLHSVIPMFNMVLRSEGEITIKTGFGLKQSHTLKTNNLSWNSHHFLSHPVTVGWHLKSGFISQKKYIGIRKLHNCYDISD